jgi:hypothetical protein
MREKDKHLTTPEILAWWNSKKDARFNTSHYLKVCAAKAMMINSENLSTVINN